MSDKEARLLARQVAKQSKCIVKFGKTNGRNCLHLRLPGNGSETIYTPAEWTYHRWNRNNEKKERE
jgi:hypothetical protein